jgi:hypothetical protein
VSPVWQLLAAQGATGVKGDKGDKGDIGAASTVPGPEGPMGQSATFLEYMFNSSITEAPSATQVRLNNANQRAATKLWLRKDTAIGFDAAVVLGILSTSYRIAIQDKDDATRLERFAITAQPIDKGLYFEVPITWTSGGTNPLVDQRVYVVLVGVGATGPKGDTGATGGPGPAGSSAYQVAVAAGYVGTPEDWLLTLKGPAGPASTVPGSAGAKGDKGDTGATGAASIVPGPQGPAGAAGADATISPNTKGFVKHGSVAGTARPSGYGSVEWQGTVEPLNAINNDTWINA